MFQSLNDRYYTLFAALYTNRALLPDKQYRMMSDALTTAYKQELDDLLSAEMLKNARQIYEMRFKKRYYIPRGFWFWRNDVSRASRPQIAVANKCDLADRESDATKRNAGASRQSAGRGTKNRPACSHGYSD